MHVTFPRVRELLQAEVKKLGSVNQVSLKTNLTNNTIAKYLDGLSEPKQDTLDKLSIYFKKPVAWLRGDSDDPSFSTDPSLILTDSDRETLKKLRKLSPSQRKAVDALVSSLSLDG